MNSPDPSCVPARGLKLRSVSVYKDMPKALSSLGWGGSSRHRSCPNILPGAWGASLAAEGAQ